MKLATIAIDSSIWVRIALSQSTNHLAPHTIRVIYSAHEDTYFSSRFWPCRLCCAQTPAAPTNDAPNPYKTVGNPFQLPDGRAWGSISTVEPDIDGKSIWIVDRCGANSCVGSNLPVVMKFDPSGKLVHELRRGHVRLSARHSRRCAGERLGRRRAASRRRARRRAAAGRRPSHREVQPRRQSAAASRHARDDRHRRDALQSAIRRHHGAERRHLRGRRPRRRDATRES